MKKAFLILFAAASLFLVAPSPSRAQQSQVMGRLKFSSHSKAIADSGVWIDGQYVGYIKELKGDNKISLLPGPHEISVRQAGYKDFVKAIVMDPKQEQTIDVTMAKDPAAEYPTGRDAAELKLNIAPARAAVFVDDGYIGHASDFGGYHIMVVTPGKHRVRVELPGYRTFETEVNPLPGQNRNQDRSSERWSGETRIARQGVACASSLMKRSAVETTRSCTWSLTATGFPSVASWFVLLRRRRDRL